MSNASNNSNLKGTTMKNSYYEIKEGINGSGETKYMVVTVERGTGRWIHTEDFKTLAEAKNWIKWS